MKNLKLSFSIASKADMHDLGVAVGKLIKSWADEHGYDDVPSIGLMGQAGKGKSTLADGAIEALTALDVDQQNDLLCEYDIDDEEIWEKGHHTDAWKSAVNAYMHHRVYDMAVFNGDDLQADSRYDCRALPERDIFPGVDIIEHYQFASAKTNFVATLCVNDNKTLPQVKWPRDVVVELSETLTQSPHMQNFLKDVCRFMNKPQANDSAQPLARHG
jgi:hypothetical protein